MTEISEIGRRRVLRYDMVCGLAPGRGHNTRLSAGPVRHMNPADKACRGLLGRNDTMPPEKIIDCGIEFALEFCSSKNAERLQDLLWGPRLLNNSINTVQGIIAGVSETGHEWRHAARRIRGLASDALTFEQRLALLTGFSSEICSPLHWREIASQELYSQTGFSEGRLTPEQEVDETEQLIKDCIVAHCHPIPGQTEVTTSNRLQTLRRKIRAMFIRIQSSSDVLWPRRMQTALEIAQELELLSSRGMLAQEVLASIRAADKELQRRRARLD